MRDWGEDAAEWYAESMTVSLAAPVVGDDGKRGEL